MTSDSKSQLPNTLSPTNEVQQTVAQALQQAVKHHKEGQRQVAEELYMAILELQPDHPDAHHNLGVLLIEDKQAELGLKHLQTAVTTSPEGKQYWMSYIDALIQTEQLDTARQTLELGRKHGLQGDEVEVLARRLEAHQPSNPIPASIDSDEETVQSKVQSAKTVKSPSRQDRKKLTNLLRKGRSTAIENFAKDLTVRYPDHGLGWKTLGGELNRRGLVNEAFGYTQKAAELFPKDPGVHNDLGLLFDKKAQYTNAENCFKKALKIDPNFTPAMCNLGNVLRVQKRFTEAESLFRRALELESSTILYNNLATTLLETGRIIEAENCYRRALKITPGFAMAHVNLGICLRKQGRLNEAIKHQRRAVKLNPNDTEQLSNLLFTLNYSTNSTNFFLEETQQFSQLITKKVKEPFSTWPCSGNPERLRVGFVSGDLYNHPVGFFLESILESFDSDRVELIAYPSSPITDDLTNRIKTFFHEWAPIFDMNDEAAARKIRADKVHILIDLSGHTSHNRLPMFAWKPAPIQACWLGYFATTGVAEMDYFLADKVGVPPSNVGNFTEKIWYLPDTRLCFSLPNYEVPVAPLPAIQNGYITFGCFQLLTKVGDDMLRLWGEILTKLPEAKLRWQCLQFDDPIVVEQLFKRLELCGVDTNRVTVHGKMGRKAYLAAHSEVDIILDTSPFPGGTTTCEALWMGVPTLTLAGESLLSRQGASLLSAAGLNEWISTSTSNYVEKAFSMASDHKKLASLRAKLREQVIGSPLFDAKLFTKNFENALWGMWQEKAPREEHLEVKDQESPRKKVGKLPVMNFFNPVFWGTEDPEQFKDLMTKASKLTTAYHFGDNMFLFQRNNSMLNDQPFMDSWEKNAITPPDRTIIWRRYILAMAAFHCQHLEGDFVECGAYHGVGAKTVIDYLGGPDFKKTFWLYDLFEHKENMTHHSLQGHGPQLHEQVVKRFKKYPNVKIFKGFLPEILEKGSPEKIAYLHLDLNQAPAEIATLDALFDRVVPGGMIILDDYEMLFYRAQKLAEDTWFGERGYKVFPLPTSQGFVIKR